MNSKDPVGSGQGTADQNQAFAIEVRVYFEDTDAGGIVYYANYLRFMERARTEFLRSRGLNLGALAESDNLTFIVVSADVRYLKPARLDDWLWVSAGVGKIGRSAIVFDQQVRRSGACGELLCTGRIRAACVSADNLKPRSIPRELIK